MQTLTVRGILAWDQRGTYHFWRSPDLGGLIAASARETVSWPWHHLRAGGRGDGPIRASGGHSLTVLWTWGPMVYQEEWRQSAGRALLMAASASSIRPESGLSDKFIGAASASRSGSATNRASCWRFMVRRLWRWPNFSRPRPSHRVDLSDWVKLSLWHRPSTMKGRMRPLLTVLVLGMPSGFLQVQGYLAEKDQHQFIHAKPASIPALILTVVSRGNPVLNKVTKSAPSNP